MVSRFFRYFLILLMTLSAIHSYPSDAFALSSKLKFSSYNAGYYPNATSSVDLGNKNSARGSRGNSVWLKLPETHYIDGFFLARHYGSPVIDLRMYDKDGVLLKTFPSIPFGTTVPISQVRKVKTLEFYFQGDGNIGEPAFYGEVDDTTPPAVPKNVVAKSEIEAISVDWANATELDFAGWNVYVNGVKNASMLILKPFKITNGIIPDQMYSIQVSAVDKYGNESALSAPVTSSAQAAIKVPVLSAVDIKDTSVRLEWDKTGISYRIFKDGELYESTTQQFLNVTMLSPVTNYQFYVESTDKYGRVSTSNLLPVTTKPLEMAKPILSISNLTHNSFEVKWNQIPYASGYKISLDGLEIADVLPDTVVHSFSGLQPERVYAVTVTAYNDFDSKVSTISTTTKSVPRPEIHNAKVSSVPGSPTKKTLSYSANEHVTSVNVYLDGKLIGTYPVTDQAIQLDLSDITGLTAGIKIEPVDENGVPYEFQTPAKSTGSEEVDDFLSDFLEGFGISNRGFVYLALASVPLLLIIVLFFWLRRKFQGTFGKTANQKGEQKDSKGAAIRQANKDKFDPDPPKATGGGPRRKFKPWDQMTEKEKDDWKERKNIKPSSDNQRKGNSLSGVGGSSGGKRGSKPKGTKGARASPKPQVQSYKGKTYNLGGQGDYKPFRTNGRNFK